jgi:uncharacterized protein (TIGR02421 family)
MPSLTREDRREHDRIRRAAARLRDAEQPLRVLRTIAWPPEVRDRFFAAGARELPRVEYEAPATGPTQEALAAARRERRDDPDSLVDAWLARQADTIATAAEMLGGVGTPAFHHASRRLYGAPSDPILGVELTTLDLARQLESSLAELDGVDLGEPPPECHLAASVAETMREAVETHFGDRAPEVVVVDQLSANALAGPRAIRLRRQACFSDVDVQQLIHHEAFVHVATSLNGLDQRDLPILAASHPGTTSTQEGLAVFAEFISGTLDPHRLRRLADRVLAIQMATDGADFLEVYRDFLRRGAEAQQAFENARRVFRGTPLTGGAPFTKDQVYLGGLLELHNFLRVAVTAGRADCFRLLFCGKLDLHDLPALGRLTEMGLCQPATFLPPWAADLRFLVSYLAYSGFLNRLDLAAVRRHFEGILRDTVRVTSSRADAATA